MKSRALCLLLRVLLVVPAAGRTLRYENICDGEVPGQREARSRQPAARRPAVLPARRRLLLTPVAERP